MRTLAVVLLIMFFAGCDSGKENLPRIINAEYMVDTRTEGGVEFADEYVSVEVSDPSTDYFVGLLDRNEPHVRLMPEKEVYRIDLLRGRGDELSVSLFDINHEAIYEAVRVH